MIRIKNVPIMNTVNGCFFFSLPFLLLWQIKYIFVFLFISFGSFLLFAQAISKLTKTVPRNGKKDKQGLETWDKADNEGELTPAKEVNAVSCFLYADLSTIF